MDFYVMIPGDLPALTTGDNKQDAVKQFARANQILGGRLVVINPDAIKFVDVSAGTTPLTVTDTP